MATARIHGIEFYRGKTIFYSLGNFTFHEYEEEKRRYWLRQGPAYDERAFSAREYVQSYTVKLLYRGKELESVRLIPLQLDSAGEASPASEEVATELRERLLRFSTNLDPAFEFDEEGFVRGGPAGS